MLELNKIMLVGRLTRDPEYRATSTGRAVARLSLAVNRRSYNKESGNQQEEVMFIEVDAWERTAEFCKNYLHKASGVYVEGRLKQDNWQDKETGANRSKLMVVAERIQFAETKAEAAERQGGMAASGGVAAPASQDGAPSSVMGPASPGVDEDAPQGGGAGSTDDDLPF
jgi:single-strand DNA-binding protein